jgi:acyl-CoA thioesterase
LSERASIWNRRGVLPTFDVLDLQPTEDPARFRMTARKDLCTPFEFLYGGSGIAASVEAAERATQRPLQWITTQFIGVPTPGDVVDLAVVTAKEGRVTAQTQVFATVDGEPVLASLCAHTTRPDGDHAQFLTMPDVPAPDECRGMSEPFPGILQGSFFEHLDRRVAAGKLALDAVDDPQTGIALWCRIPGHHIGSPATQAFVADIVPMAVCAALGSMPGGTSIDNTIRIMDTTPTEWVLLELIAEGFNRSVGHGSVRIWSQEGRLMAVAQQTCIIRTARPPG